MAGIAAQHARQIALLSLIGWFLNARVKTCL
jgi:hypothetical protein